MGKRKRKSRTHLLNQPIPNVHRPDFGARQPFFPRPLLPVSFPQLQSAGRSDERDARESGCEVGGLVLWVGGGGAEGEDLKGVLRGMKNSRGDESGGEERDVRRACRRTRPS